MLGGAISRQVTPQHHSPYLLTESQIAMPAGLKRPAPRTADTEEPEERPTTRRMTRTPAPAESAPRSRRAEPEDEADDGVDDETFNRLVGQSRKEADRIAKETPKGDFAPKFEPPDSGDAVLVKFLQDEPFAAYNEHWCNWMPQGKKKSYICIKVDCPLCAIGDSRARYQEKWNVIDLSDIENPVNAVWTVGYRDSQRLKALDRGERSGPIGDDKIYYEVSRTGLEDRKNVVLSRIVTSIAAVRQRTLEDPEGWNVEAFSSEELDEFRKKLFTAKKEVQISPRAELEAVADAHKG